MRSIRRGLAVMLSVLLMIPTQPVMAAEPNPPEVREERVTGQEEAGKEESLGEVSLDETALEEDVVSKKEELKEEEGSVENQTEDTTEEPEQSEDDSEEDLEEDLFEDEVLENDASVDEAGENQDSDDAVDHVTDEEFTGEEENGTEEADAVSTDKELSTEGDDVVSATTEFRDEDTVEKADHAKEVVSSQKDDSEEEEVLEEELLDADEIVLLEEVELASPANAQKASEPQDEVKFNTGNHVFSVVSREDFFDNELGDAFFEEDGSYTINIPEPNPFFPYEVQFTYEGKENNVWFMTPDDSVEIGGHKFHVSAYFDGTVVTQMNFKVGDDLVVVYPDEKVFTDEEEAGMNPASMLPLEEQSFTADLTRYTPAELTMVALNDIFTGDTALGPDDKVMWAQNGDDYTVSAPGDIINLSYDTYSSGYNFWEMIVGDDDQLAAGNIRYQIRMDVTRSGNWLTPAVSVQDEEGNRKALTVISDSTYYIDWDENSRELQIPVSSDQLERRGQAYISLAMNSSVFASPEYDHFKVYEGEFTTAQEAMAATDITDQLFAKDMTQKDAGYRMEHGTEPWITMVTFDAAGKVTGCLPFYLYLSRRNMDSHLSYQSPYFKYGENGYHQYVVDSVNSSRNGRDYDYTFTLYSDFAADRKYYLGLSYIAKDQTTSSNADVTAAYVGNYTLISEATAAGASDIKAELFGGYDAGYEADYSEGVMFTVFVGADGTETQEVFHFNAKTETGTRPYYSPSSDTNLTFYAFSDKDGNQIQAYQIPNKDTNNRYLTVLVPEDIDLTNIAPYFYVNDKANVYVSGGNAPEKSGESYHDFSKGPVEYTVAAEDGTSSRNYWVHVVKVGAAGGQLYINSLEEEASKTKVENGVIYSTREMFLDGRYDHKHDIVLVNLGKDPLTNLSAELVSNEVELDPYWTLSGDYALAGVGTIDEAIRQETISLTESDLWNQAMLRILPKEGVADGREIQGTLTIRSGETVLMVLTLTGTVGDPSIVTKDIPDAVKYVPYGTMIQNSNKYSWNTPGYQLVSGTLPGGMEVRPNGELYGVPTETGTFTFTVRMENSYPDFGSSQREFTLTVIENTDTNVDAATDQGYTLTQRVQSMPLNAAYDQTMVSEGIYGEFQFVFLDGEKLVEGQDYTSESGSTRITIRGETLKKSNKTGTHTLGIEFRTTDNTLKRAAQNFELTDRRTSGGSSGSGGSGGGSSSSGSSSSGTVTTDPKKGQINSLTGIITSEASGYSNWHQDENGWKLVYADGTVAAGYMAQQENGTTVEQVIWEKINGNWYAFGANGYIKSGWVFDYQLGSWYAVTVEKGMQSGWYTDAQDGFTYYLDPANGKIVGGWRQIDSKWYYFNDIVYSPTWVYNQQTGAWNYNPLSRTKPYGAMYSNELTPDGYQVGADGVWSN